MNPKLGRLTKKFLMASSLIVLATIVCGSWSGYMFARLSRVIGDALQKEQQVLEQATDLSGRLEREDDALLLTLTSGSEALPALRELRRSFDLSYQRIDSLLVTPEGQKGLAALRTDVDAYRSLGQQLIRVGNARDALAQYHQGANLQLRRAVADCQQLRERAFMAIQHAGVQARDEARRAIRIVGLLVLIALLVSLAAAHYLARQVVRPIVELTSSVEALRRGEFGCRVPVPTQDEIGLLAEEFNRMVSALEEFRRSNLGATLRAKTVLEATLEALPDAIIVVELDGGLVSMNRLARLLFLGCETAPMPAAYHDLALPAQVVSAVQMALGGKPCNLLADPHEAFAWADKTPRWLLPIAIPLEAGERFGAILVLHNVTEFMRLDELRGEVVALTSHELKTPLTSLRVNLMLLAEGMKELPPRQQEIVTTALTGCEELGGIIERLLDLARIEAGQLQLSRELVDLRQLIAQTMARYREPAGEAGVHIEAAVETAVYARVDAARLGIVLSNLINNALKYTPRSGRICIRCLERPASLPGDCTTVQIEVVDTGRGIPEALRECVFEKFYRIENQYPKHDIGARGTGLGLYLCKQIILAHGGTIDAEAGVAGVGTRIRLVLPGQPPCRPDKSPLALGSARRS